MKFHIYSGFDLQQCKTIKLFSWHQQHTAEGTWYYQKYNLVFGKVIDGFYTIKTDRD